jgi:hypothetical protein
MQSPSMGQPLPAPTPPPPPPANSRLPWPPPPGGAPGPGWPASPQASSAGGPPPGGPQSPPAESQLSDTMDRMLRPQGLFHNAWQQPWATPPVNGGMQAPPPAPPTPVGGSYQPGGGYPAGGPVTPAGQYPPGQYGQGQYQPGMDGPGQYAPGQYGPQGQYGQGAQFGGDQFNQGQYPPGQYGPGQYPPEQYQTGQFGPGVGSGFGPGAQFGPDGSPIPDQKPALTFGKITLPRGPLVPAIVIAALVAIVATAVVLSSSGGTKPTAGGATPTPTSSVSAAGANSQMELQAATQLSGLLAQSGTDHSRITTAVVNVEACGSNLGQDAQIFTKSAANRKTLLAKLAQLPGRSALPAAMVTDLTGAWQASAAVDTDLAKWASHAATAGCHGGDTHYKSYLATHNDNVKATNDKDAFVIPWNRLAKKDGLPTYVASQL